MSKLLRARKKRARCTCIGHNQENCSNMKEIRPALTRAYEKVETEKEIDEQMGIRPEKM